MGDVVSTCSSTATDTTLAGSEYDLRNEQTGAVTVFTPAIGANPACITLTGCVRLDGLGADWVSIEPPSADPEHSVQQYDYQNLLTGATSRDPSNLHTTIDLNSPNLALKVCSPLSVPRDDGNVEGTEVPGWGTVVFDGRFAIATGRDGVYLERCGTRFRQFLTFTAGSFCGHPGCPPAANAHAVVWQLAPGKLAGVLLPSLQKFVIRIPASIDPNHGTHDLLDDRYSLWLTPSTLYLGLINGGGVWTVASPKLTG